MNNIQRVFREDNAFWDMVNLSISTIFRVFGVSVQRTELIDPVTGDMKIVAVPMDWSGYPWIVGVYSFFASSPNFFVPNGKLVVDMRNGIPAVFGKRELLVSLWQTAGGQGNIEVSEICRKLDVVFRREMESELDFDFSHWLSQNPEEVRHARKTWEYLYEEWHGYVSRHYDKTLKGTDDQGRQRFNIRLLEGRRNREIGRAGPAVADMFSSLRLLDKTLCFIEEGANEGSRSGCVISKENLLQIMKRYEFSSKYLPDIKKILRLDQKIRLNEQKPTMANQVQKSAFVFVSPSKVYNVNCCEVSNSFDCGMVPFQRKVPVVKSIYLRDTKVSKPPKDYLYALSNGRWDNFCAIAKIVCLATAGEKLFSGVIVGDEQSVAEITALLEWISGRTEDNVVLPCKMSDLSKTKMKDDLISMKIDGRLFGVCQDDVNRLNPEQWVRMTKIFSGATVTYKDSMLGRKMHKNMMQWIVIGDDLTHQKLGAHGVKTEAIPEVGNLDDVDGRGSLWLQIILPLWGYLLHKNEVSAQTRLDVRMPVVRRFMNCCCQQLSEDGDFLSARELYDHYVCYCQMLECRDALKFKDFNAVLESDYNMKRTRFHTADGTNKTGFRRLRFIGMEVAASQTLTEPAVEREKFFEQLDQITEEVKEHFPNWPFGKLL